MLLAAAVVVLALVFVGGYIAGNGSGHGLSAGHVLALKGTAQAPHALASLRVEPVDSSGNWPMQLSATGLPKLPNDGYYVVYLVRHGELYAPCGSFIVAGESSGVSVSFNAPYRLQPGDSWVVARHVGGRKAPSTVVLRPIT
jgi:hypothetical protein